MDKSGIVLISLILCKAAILWVQVCDIVGYFIIVSVSLLLCALVCYCVGKFAIIQVPGILHLNKFNI